MMTNFFSPNEKKTATRTEQEGATATAAAPAATASSAPTEDDALTATTTTNTNTHTHTNTNPQTNTHTHTNTGSSFSSPVNTMMSSSSVKTRKSRSAAASINEGGGGGGGGGGDGTATSSAFLLDDQIKQLKRQIGEEKAGKRKLFHSLVKLANELRRIKQESVPLVEQQSYDNRNWYHGGMWRAPQVLPGVAHMQQQQQRNNLAVTGNSARARQAISLSDLFFNLVIVTAFTRVGVAISQTNFIDTSRLLYFAVFWQVWSKETSYSTRFDTTDLSAQVVTLVSCFAVLFASLSVQAALDTPDGTRVMIMAAFVAALHCLLHVRVFISTTTATSSTSSSSAATSTLPSTAAAAATTIPLYRHVQKYAIFNIVMNLLETTVWCIGIFVFEATWPYRWLIFLTGVLLALRVPRAFLANDFHAACSKRGVLFILLLGFLLQSIVVVASEFFTYQTPQYEHYCFVGAACLMLYCIKLLYVDDSDTLAEDHALLVNRTAGFFFNVGQFLLLLSTTIMGSGLNLLTHDYLAATAALPGTAKNMVCGGFSATLFSTFFIKSMHLKRVPTDARNQCLFISAFMVQSIVLFIVVAITAAMCAFSQNTNMFLGWLMQSDILLLFGLSLAALVIVVLSWLDEGVELTLYRTAEDSRAFRIHPFGFWWCLKPDISDDDLAAAMADQQVALEQSNNNFSSRRLSALSPLLGSSVVALRDLDYQSMSQSTTSINMNMNAAGASSYGGTMRSGISSSIFTAPVSPTRLSRSADDLKHGLV